MTEYFIYDLTTGLFTGCSFASNIHDPIFVEMNTPKNCGVITEVTDPLSQRVDLDTGFLADYMPPAPSSRHQWNADQRRWELRASELERDRVINQIHRLEMQALRPQREITMARELGGQPAKREALDRLESIEAEIQGLRLNLTGLRT